MAMLEQVEAQVKLLSKAEQEALLDWLGNVLEDGMELTDEFKAKLERGERDQLDHDQLRGQQHQQRNGELQRFSQPNSPDADRIGDHCSPDRHRHSRCRSMRVRPEL